MTTSRRIFCIFSLVWSPDGTRLAIGGTGTTVRILDVATLASRLVYRGHAAVIRSVTWSPDGCYIASASEDHSIQVWGTGDGGRVAAWPLRWPHRVAWSPRGDLLAASSHSGTVELWKTDDWTHARTVPGGASSLAWSPNGRWLAIGNIGEVRLVPIMMADMERTLACRALKYVLALSWSPGGDRLAVGGNNPQAVEVWEVAPMPTPGAEAPCLTYRGHSSYIWSVDWAPSGQWIASGSWGQIHLWDPSSGTLRATYHGHVGDVYGLAYSPDGTRIASGGRDRTLQVWNTGDTILGDGDQSVALRGREHA